MILEGKYVVELKTIKLFAHKKPWINKDLKSCFVVKIHAVFSNSSEQILIKKKDNDD